MDIQNRKINLIQRFLNIDNESVILNLEKVIENYDANSHLLPFTIDELNQRIDESMQDSENNEVISHQDLMIEFKSWR